jgi:Tol biopolymer transport system component
LQADLRDQTIQPFSENTNEGKCPAYSPDGSLLAFCNEEGGTSKLFTVRSDGSDPQELTDAIAGCACSPDAPLAWSPDGKWIGLPVNMDAQSYVYDIYVVNIRGKKAINLTSNPQRYGGLVWNPDNRSVLFTGEVGGQMDIYQVDIADKKITPFSSQPITGAASEWAPDGRKLAYFADSGGGNFDIYIFEKNNGESLQLTDAAGFDSYPHWFPDGQKILIISKRDGEDEIFSMDADGSDQKNLTENPNAMDIWPSISRDGQTIVYLTAENSQWKVMQMNADGSGKKEITGLVGIPSTISWRP